MRNLIYYYDLLIRMRTFSIVYIKHGLLDVVPRKNIDKTCDNHMHNFDCDPENVIVDVYHR